MSDDTREREAFKTLRRRADKARDFPINTDPCSRHAYLMAENMVKKHGYPMLAEEPLHCATSIMGTVASLWETRARLAALERSIATEGSTNPATPKPVQDKKGRSGQ